MVRQNNHSGYVGGRRDPVSIGFLLISMLLVCAAQPRAQEGSTRKAEDKGDFIVEFTPVRNQKYATWAEELQESKHFEEVAASLNRLFALPHDIRIVFRECGQTKAFYNSKTGEISMCYERFTSDEGLLLNAGYEKNDVKGMVVSLATWMLFHELAHALIQVFGLPVTGGEEDAADQLATFMMLGIGDEGEEAALDVAERRLLGTERNEKKGRGPNFSNEHSLDQQRYSNVLCWVYGSSSEKHAYIVKEGSLPRERAAGCKREYEQISSSWLTSLAPFIKQ